MADASVQNDEVDVEEVPVPPALAPTRKGRRKKMVNRTKLGNFNPDEDVNIAKSWLEISCGPITSTAKKRSHTTHAAANFAGILKHNFAYMHCWEIMKDEPKWQDPKPRGFGKSTGGDGFGEDSSHEPDTNDLGDDNSSPTGSARRRPMGRDSAKAAKKKANSFAGSTSSSEYASRMQDLSLQKISILQEESMRKTNHFQQLACIDEKWFEKIRSHNQSLLDIEQEKIRIMREKHDMDKKEKEKQEDERILGIDLNACTPAQQMYYEALQEEIFEKIAARRGKRQGP
uniref:No apical meristem-associated C-terminal domain-containing protein n=1 Tax=Setaria italica TaxID=4555 RepID=K3ZM75_SETIT